MLATTARTLLLVLGLLLLAIAPLAVADEEAGDDGRLVARFFDVEALTQGHVTFIEAQLALISPDMVSDEENPLFGAEGEEPILPVGTIDELMELIVTNVDPVSWQITPGAEIVAVGEHSLLVQTTKPVIDQVARYLAELESDVLTTITVEVRALSIDGPVGALDAEALLASGTPGPAVVLTALTGQRAAAFAGGQDSFVQDYDTEVAEDSSASDPIVGIINHGLVVATRSRLGSDARHIRVDLDVTLARLLDMRSHTSMSKRLIELPTIESVDLHTQLLLEPGVWHVGEGRVQGPDAGRWIFLVRAAALRAPPKPTAAPALYDPHMRAGKGDLVARTYDVSDLYEATREFVGQEINLVPSNFTPPEPPELAEPAPVMAIDTLAELIPTLVVPGSWKRDGTGIMAWNGRLTVTNTAVVLDEVAKALAGLRRQFLWTIALDVEVIDASAELGLGLAAPTPDGAGYLVTARERAAIQAAVADGTAEIVDRVRVLSLAGARNALTSGRWFSYVQDYEVEIAQGVSIGNPVVQVALEGIVADMRPALTTTRDSVNLTARITRARRASQRTVETPLGSLDAPALEITRARSNLRVPLGETAILAVDGRGGGARVILVTPRLEVGGK